MFLWVKIFNMGSKHWDLSIQSFGEVHHQDMKGKAAHLLTGT